MLSALVALLALTIGEDPSPSPEHSSTLAVPLSEIQGMVTTPFNREPERILFAIQKGWPATDRRSIWGMLLAVSRKDGSPALFPFLFDCGPLTWGFGVISLSLSPDDSLLMVASGQAGGLAVEVFPMATLMDGFGSRNWRGASHCAAPMASVGPPTLGWIEFEGWADNELLLRSTHALRSADTGEPEDCCDGKYRYRWDPVADRLTALPDN